MAKRLKTDTWQQRDAKRKRDAAKKAKLLAAAYDAVETMLADPAIDHFNIGERKALAEASYAIRSVAIGYAGRKR